MTESLCRQVYFNLFLRLIVLNLYIHLVLCYDIELEGKMHLSDAFINSIKSGKTKPKQFAESLIKEVEKTIINSPNLEGMNIKIPYDLTSVFRKALITRKAFDDDSYQGVVISNFIIHLKEKAVKRLKILSKELKKHFHLSVMAPLDLKKVTSNYGSRMKSYLKIILNEKFETNNEKELLLMDIVETSNKILYSETRMLLNQFIDHNQEKVVDEDIRAATQTLYKKNVESKKADYNYLCLDMGICRSYPAFTDYLAELFSEVLKASNHKFHNFLLISLKLVKDKHKFLERALGKQTAKNISKLIEEQISNDWKTARESFSVLRGIITRRHEWLYDRSKPALTRTTAIRLFLDIIDKSFEDVGEVSLATQFDTTASALRDWIAGFRNDLQSILLIFFRFAADIFANNLTVEGMMELKALTDLILGSTGTPNTVLQYELVSKGSRFVGRTNVE